MLAIGDVSAAAVAPLTGGRTNGGAPWKLPYRSGVGNQANKAVVTPGIWIRGCGGRVDPLMRARMRRMVEQMSGSQQKGYQGLCWNCSKPGAYAGNWRMKCPGCEVSWMAWSSALGGDPDHDTEPTMRV